MEVFLPIIQIIYDCKRMQSRNPSFHTTLTGIHVEPRVARYDFGTGCDATMQDDGAIFNARVGCDAGRFVPRCWRFRAEDFGALV